MARSVLGIKCALTTTTSLTITPKLDLEEMQRVYAQRVLEHLSGGKRYTQPRDSQLTPEQFDKRESIYLNRLMDILAPLMNPGQSWLEIGAGLCTTTVKLLQRIDPLGCSWWGTDIHELIINSGKAELEKAGFGKYTPNYVFGPACELTRRLPDRKRFTPRTFDAIFLHRVMFKILGEAEFKQSLVIFEQLLKRGGVLIVVEHLSTVGTELLNPRYYPHVPGHDKKTHTEVRSLGEYQESMPGNLHLHPQHPNLTYPDGDTYTVLVWEKKR